MNSPHSSFLKNVAYPKFMKLFITERTFVDCLQNRRICLTIYHTLPNSESLQTKKGKQFFHQLHLENFIKHFRPGNGRMVKDAVRTVRDAMCNIRPLGLLSNYVLHGDTYDKEPQLLPFMHSYWPNIRRARSVKTRTRPNMERPVHKMFSNHLKGFYTNWAKM